MENKEVTQNLDAALPDEAAAPESVVDAIPVIKAPSETLCTVNL